MMRTRFLFASVLALVFTFAFSVAAQTPIPEQTACEKFALKEIKKATKDADRVFLGGEEANTQAKPRPVDVAVGDEHATLELAGKGSYRAGGEWWDFSYRCLLADPKTAVAFTMKDAASARR